MLEWAKIIPYTKCQLQVASVDIVKHTASPNVKTTRAKNTQTPIFTALQSETYRRHSAG